MELHNQHTRPEQRNVLRIPDYPQAVAANSDVHTRRSTPLRNATDSPCYMPTAHQPVPGALS